MFEKRTAGIPTAVVFCNGSPDAPKRQEVNGNY
jgi:hypothetical protein